MCHAHTSMSIVPYLLGGTWDIIWWSYDGFQGSVQFVSASVPSRYNVCFKWMSDLACTTFFFPFSSLISMLAIEKLKAVFHFVIFLYQVPNLLIIIYFIWDGLWNLIFFSIPSSFNFFLSKFGLHSFNLYLFYLRWFLDFFLISSFKLFSTNLILIILIVIFFSLIVFFLEKISIFFISYFNV